MGFAELSIDLRDDQKALRDETKRFCAEVWRPAAIELDRLHDPQDVISEMSILWDVLKASYRLGYHSMALPKDIGGMGLDGISMALVQEQMGWAAPDIAVSLGASCIPFAAALLSLDPDVRHLAQEFCADTEAKLIGCWAITEHEHGSDWNRLEEDFSRTPRSAPSVKAVQDGEEYVISGQKSSWVSNGTIATHALLYLNLNPSVGMDGCGVAVVPLNYPGVTRGKPLDKLGQRALNQGEIFFDNVRIPKANIVCQDLITYNYLADVVLAACNTGMGNMFVGVAQAGLDEALRYSKERVQGGKAIFNHQNVKLKLFDMFVSVEAARSLARRVAAYNSVANPPAVQYAIAAKVLSTETAFRVASQAIQIFGGCGLCREFHIEKIFRDARAAMIEDGVNETLALAAARRL